MMITLQTSEAFILHVRPYRETSALLSVLTEQYGCLSLIAKGARRPKSPHKGILQPFQQVSLQWKRSGEMGTLYQADLIELIHPITQMARLSGFYLNELLYKLLPHEVTLAFFQCYKQTLTQLNTPHLETALRFFEKQLLEVMGYAIDYAKDRHGHPIVEESLYTYQPTAGFDLAVGSGGNLFRGASIVALGKNTLESTQLQEAKRLLRQALHVQLRGRKLMSRDLVREFIHAGNLSGCEH